MSQEQINRYVVIQKSLEGAISVEEAATALNLSNHQVILLCKGVKENGSAALIHKNQSRRPAHATPEELIAKIVNFKLSDKFRDFFCKGSL